MAELEYDPHATEIIKRRAAESALDSPLRRNRAAVISVRSPRRGFGRARGDQAL